MQHVYGFWCAAEKWDTSALFLTYQCTEVHLLTRALWLQYFMYCFEAWGNGRSEVAMDSMVILLLLCKC